MKDGGDTVSEDVPNDPWLSCNILSDCGHQPTRRRKARPARMGSRKARVPKGEKEVSVMMHNQQEKKGEDAPRTSFTNTDSRACKVISKALVMLKQATQLELGHGLFVGTRAHNVLGLL